MATVDYQYRLILAVAMTTGNGELLQ